jgi:hypothetical protein
VYEPAVAALRREELPEMYSYAARAARVSRRFRRAFLREERQPLQRRTS